ncbi:hypothetical protein HPB51_017842 [Rhipicephalus microplus]|uniref:Kelch domain-containing protein 3 n=1 Tax=Rhipicephalus microplus TaxID=6941 RepID=A0A9J6E3M6_RHIMP|nr:hypothetical protein HPB51_017842 [Rhipicephalus microplus]
MKRHLLNTFYDLKAEPSRSPTDVPFQRYGHTVMGYGDYAYLWGGRNDDGACNTLYRFDTNTLTWSRPKVCGHVPGARDGHSACVMGNRMYVFGGFEEQADRFSQDVHYLDLDTMLWQYVPTRVRVHSVLCSPSCLVSWLTLGVNTLLRGRVCIVRQNALMNTNE